MAAARFLRGKALVAALQRKLAPRIRGRAKVRDALAKMLGYSTVQIWNWEDKNRKITPAQIANLVAKAAQQAQRETIKPIIEFFDFVPTNERLVGSKKKLKKLKNYKLFDGDNTYEKGVREELKAKHGV